MTEKTTADSNNKKQQEAIPSMTAVTFCQSNEQRVSHIEKLYISVKGGLTCDAVNTFSGLN